MTPSLRSKRPLRRHRSSCGGFTLIEVLVAMVLLAVGVVAVMRVVSATTLASGQARDSIQATTLARQEMNEIIQTEGLSTGTQSGDFGNDFPNYRWESDVEESSDVTGLWTVQVVVYWKSGVTQKKVQLSTMMLPPPDTTAGNNATGANSGGTTTGGNGG